MIGIKLEVSLLIASLINIIQCFNISLKQSESVDTITTMNNSSNNDNKNNSNSNRKSIPIMLPTTQQLLLEYCMCISCICLTVHLIVYAFVPKLQTTPGKCLMSLSLSLLLAAIMFIISFHIKPDPNNYVCVSIGLIRFYTFLASFCWMNVLAYDVYKTFAKPNSSLRKQSLSQNSLKMSQKQNFRIYSLYAWLLPAIILMISVTVQAITPFDSPYNPAYGKRICGISHFTAVLIYFMFPVSIILTLNVILFIITARKIKLTVKETRFATKSKAKYYLLLHIKLVVVLGLPWILWFVAMFTEIPLFTYPTLLLHGLHGAFIFVAFTVKRSVYRLIVSRIKYLRGDEQIRVSTVMTNNVRRRTVESVESSKSDTVITFYIDKSFRERCSSI